MCAPDQGAHVHNVIECGGLWWVVTSGHPVSHRDVEAAAAHAAVTGSVGCNYNDAVVARLGRMDALGTLDLRLPAHDEPWGVCGFCDGKGGWTIHSLFEPPDGEACEHCDPEGCYPTIAPLDDMSAWDAMLTTGALSSPYKRHFYDEYPCALYGLDKVPADAPF
jgi:hypothetical protein